MLTVPPTICVTSWVRALPTRAGRAAALWRCCSSLRAGARRLVAPCQRTPSRPARARPTAVSRFNCLSGSSIARPERRPAPRPGLSRRVVVRRRLAGRAAHALWPPQADAARRRHRPHGLRCHRPACREGTLRCAKGEVRPAPAGRRGHMQLFGFDPNGAKVELDFSMRRRRCRAEEKLIVKRVG